MFLVITIITFLIGAVLCLVKGKTFDHCRPEILRKLLRVLSNSELNGYLVKRVVAFLGITLAITFTNFNTVRQEQRWTVEFMEDVLLTEIDTKITLLNEAAAGMDTDSDSEIRIETEALDGGEISIDVKEPSDPQRLFETMKVYPISPVSSLDDILEDAPYKYTISRYSYSALIDCRMNFMAQKTRIDHAGSIEEMTEHLRKMLSDFERAHKIIEIELRYQNGRIGESEVKTEIKKLYDELRKNEEAIVVG